MARKPYTGGPLNWLNGKAGISAPKNSVAVSALVRAHHPKSAAELETLIASHQHDGCWCGIVSCGTVQAFGRNLYNAQLQHWGEYRFSLRQCIQWEYDLFVLQMLKGTLMEDRCRELLEKRLPPGLEIYDSNRYVDEELRVDLEIRRCRICLAGIQVKPLSFQFTRKNVQTFNHCANQRFGRPVYYAYYETDSQAFVNLDSILSRVVKLQAL